MDIVEVKSPVVAFATQSESILKIAAALCAVLPDIPEIPKHRKARIATKSGGSYEYAFADLSDILSAATKPLATHGLCVVYATVPNERGSVLTGTLLHAPSGEWMRAGLQLPHMANPQDLGSLLSYLKRYIFGLLVPIVASEPDDDGQRATSGAQDDEAAQAAILEVKRKERDAAKTKAKAEGRFQKVEAMPADNPAAPSEPENAKSAPEKPIDAVVTQEPPAEPPPNIPTHLEALSAMMNEDRISQEKFMHWLTHPYKNLDGMQKGAIKTEGTKFEALDKTTVSAIIKQWPKIVQLLS